MFGNVPLTLIVPVVGSTALSMKLMRPLDGGRSSLGATASTLSVPCPMYRLKSVSSDSGTANET